MESPKEASSLALFPNMLHEIFLNLFIDTDLRTTLTLLIFNVIIATFKLISSLTAFSPKTKKLKYIILLLLIIFIHMNNEQINLLLI